MINFFKEDIVFRMASRQKLLGWIPYIIRQEGKKAGDVNIILCSDQYLLTMNRQYLNHDVFTDIITFDFCQGPLVAGDLFISIDRVKDNAAHYGHSVQQELARMVAHGVLHLCGYQDKTKGDKHRMTKKEDHYLAKMLARR